MPGLNDARVASGTGALSFPSTEKASAASGNATVTGSLDSSATAKQIDDLEALVTLLSTNLTAAQNAIAALEARVSDLEA